MKYIWLICLIFCINCSDRYTWGEASEEISEAYCEALNHCTNDSLGNEYINKCIKHSVFHLCELDKTCNEEIGSDGEDAVNECMNALEHTYEKNEDDSFKDGGEGCIRLLFVGALPSECSKFFEYRP